ncbi:hypothetical protein [Lysobacter sp. CA199]|uniref:hypothetical protein n=1 Tax=Lysobacter sp. CA199 TaxID=3455608 RepID=UPI003F8D860A
MNSVILANACGVAPWLNFAGGMVCAIATPWAAAQGFWRIDGAKIDEPVRWADAEY